MHQQTRIRSVVFAAAVGGLLFPGPGHAQGVEEFYRGRTVNLMIGYSVGGGYDLYGRLVSRHIGKHIPGRPAVVPQNMTGAGSLRAAQYIYSVAPKDGTTFGTFGRTIATTPLLTPATAQFDGTRFTWLGSVTNEVSFCASWHTSPVKSWDDALSKELIVGGNGAASDPDVYALLLKNLLGAKIKLVTGYPGSTDINLALERGEIAGRCGWSWDSLKSRNASWLAEGKINLLVVFAAKRNPEMPPDAPLIVDFVKSEEQRQILNLIMAREVLGRPFFGPPGIPADRAQALRAAFDDTMRDPDFLAEAKKSELEVNPVPAAEVDALLAELYRTPKDVLTKAAKAIQ